MNTEAIAELIKVRYIQGSESGVRLPSERQLAKVLDLSHGRVHQAILLLVQTGLLEVLPRFGIFTRLPGSSSPSPVELSPNCFPQSFSPIRLRVSVPFGDCSLLSRAFSAVFQDFQAECPYVSLSLDFTPVPNHEDEIDFMICCPAALERENALPLSELSQVDSALLQPLIPGIMDCAKYEGDCYAIPLLQAFASWFGNGSLFPEPSVLAQTFTDPWNFFDIGMGVRSELPPDVFDFDFRGFIYHAAPFGIELSRKEDELIFDEAKTRELLPRLKEVLLRKHMNHLLSEQRFQEIQDDKIALFCDYTSCLHLLNDGRFRFLGFPLHQGGFACQNAFMGKIGKNSRQKSNALILLEYLLRKEVQEKLCSQLPGYFSTRQDLFDEQRTRLKALYPDLSMDFLAFNIRGYHSLLDHQIYYNYGNRINFELVKYIAGLQNLQQTMDHMHKSSS